MPSLNTEILGIRFPNPFLLAAGPPTASAALVIKALRAGWGGVVLKTISMDPTPHVSPRIHVIKTGRHKWGMLDIELVSDRSVEHWGSEIDRIRDEFPDRPMLASIIGGGRPQDWQELVVRLEPHGVDGFEMNTSCPSFAAERGRKLGQDPAALGLAISWVRSVTRRPVFVKMTPNVSDMPALAQVAAQAGADGFTMGNSLIGIGGIDLDTFSPLPSVEGIGMAGGYGGPGMKPVALRLTAEISSATGLPVLGVGGIVSWRDAVEYLAVGAHAIQVCSAVMWEGFDIIKKLTRGLEDYLESKQLPSPAEIVGKALPRLRSFPDLNLSAQMVAFVEEQLCDGCGICVRSCECGGYQAITMRDPKKAFIDVGACGGCGLCVGVCPVGGISMVRKADSARR